MENSLEAFEIKAAILRPPKASRRFCFKCTRAEPPSGAEPRCQRGCSSEARCRYLTMLEAAYKREASHTKRLFCTEAALLCRVRLRNRWRRVRGRSYLTEHGLPYAAADYTKHPFCLTSEAYRRRPAAAKRSRAKRVQKGAVASPPQPRSVWRRVGAARPSGSVATYYERSEFNARTRSKVSPSLCERFNFSLLDI